METIVVAVFHLPRLLAAMTVPSEATTMRRPDTRNSLATMMRSTHAETAPCSSRKHSDTMTTSLSAIGSRNFPNVVTSLRLRAR